MSSSSLHYERINDTAHTKRNANMLTDFLILLFFFIVLMFLNDCYFLVLWLIRYSFKSL